MTTAVFHATQRDMERLRNLLDDVLTHFDGDAETLRGLRRKLDRAEVVPSIDPDVVTLYSRVHIHIRRQGIECGFELVMPEESDSKQNQVSVLAPLGAAVFGCRRGSSVEVDAPAGPRRIRILEVRQPRRAEEEHRFVVPWHMEAENQRGVLT